MKEHPSSEKTVHCLSCNEALKGDFCHKCGEKVIHPKHDYSILEFIEQTIDGFTHFDLKFIRSFKYLLFRPGLLSLDYVEGRRVKLMRPIQVFIISSLFFYLLMPNSGSFYASYEELRDGYASASFSLDNPVKYNINGKLRDLVYEKHGTGIPDSLVNKKANEIYVKAYDKAASYSKTFLFLIVPFWGLFLYALFYQNREYYVQNLIFAMHAFSFFLLSDVVFLFFLFEVFKVKVVHNTTHLLPFFILVLVYVFLAIRLFYKPTWTASLAKGLIAYLSLLALLILYRVFIMVWALNAV